MVVNFLLESNSRQGFDSPQVHQNNRRKKSVSTLPSVRIEILTTGQGRLLGLF